MVPFPRTCLLLASSNRLGPSFHPPFSRLPLWQIRLPCPLRHNRSAPPHSLLPLLLTPPARFCSAAGIFSRCLSPQAAAPLPPPWVLGFPPVHGLLSVLHLLSVSPPQLLQIVKYHEVKCSSNFLKLFFLLIFMTFLPQSQSSYKRITKIVFTHFLSNLYRTLTHLSGSKCIYLDHTIVHRHIVLVIRYLRKLPYPS